jgi:hypothetical protein
LHTLDVDRVSLAPRHCDCSEPCVGGSAFGSQKVVYVEPYPRIEMVR